LDPRPLRHQSSAPNAVASPSVLGNTTAKETKLRNVLKLLIQTNCNAFRQQKTSCGKLPSSTTIGSSTNAPLQVEEEESEEEMPQPQRRRRGPPSDESEEDEDEENGEGSGPGGDIEQLVKKFVRYALACEYQRIPIRKAAISERGLYHGLMRYLPS
jgi:hypothetical protein